MVFLPWSISAKSAELYALTLVIGGVKADRSGAEATTELDRQTGGQGGLRWPVAGHILAHAYMGQAGTGMCGHACTMGK